MSARFARHMLRSASLLAALLTACAGPSGGRGTPISGETIALTGGHGHPETDFRERPLMGFVVPPSLEGAGVIGAGRMSPATQATHGRIGADGRWTLTLPALGSESLQPMRRVENFPYGCALLEDTLRPDDAQFADLVLAAELPHREPAPHEPGTPPGFERLISQRTAVPSPGTLRMEELQLRFADRDVFVHTVIHCETDEGLFEGEQTLDLKAGWNLVQAVTTRDPREHVQKQRLQVMPLSTRLPLTSTH